MKAPVSPAVLPLLTDDAPVTPLFHPPFIAHANGPMNEMGINEMITNGCRKDSNRIEQVKKMIATIP